MPSSNSISTVRDTLARSMVLALLLAFGIYIVGYLSAPGQTALAAGTVSGAVYRDYNADGDRDTREPGLGGITVRAYNAAGTIVQSATTFPVCTGLNAPVNNCTGINTPAPGAYTLGSMADGRYRIEFTTGNTGLKPGAFGSGNGTTVQFVDVTAGNVSNVNASFNAPRDYCQSNPDLITPCYVDGNQGGTDGVLFSHDYGENSATASPASKATEATETQIGSTWGLAYRSTTNQLYAAAFLKRAAGFDTTPALQDRPGQIYRVTPGGAADGAPFVVIPNAGGIGGVGGTDLHSDFNPSDSDGDFDSEAFPLVGKASLGDIELNGDESALYVVNLNNRSLYVVTNLDGAPSAALVGVIPNPTGAGNEGCTTRGVGRPFGLGWRDDLLYVGGVCTGENGGTASDLKAYVYTYNPATNAFSADPVLSFSLYFDRECINIGGGSYAGLSDCRAGASVVERPDADWRPWTDAFGTMVDINNADNNDTFAYDTGNGGYPMAMLSDIVFDGDDMLLGFRDRGGDMIGYQDPGPTQSHGGNNEPVLLNATGAGDLYRANPNSSGTWTIENASQSNPSGIFGPTTNSSGVLSPQGPGGGEFYAGDNHNNHDETIVGGLAQVPGNDEVVMTVLDPDVTGADLFNGGTMQLSNINIHTSVGGTDDDGQRVRSVELYDTAVSFSGDVVDTDRFSKANGMGDLEALCNAAPLEVGNRVWRDTDGDGVQDPGEMPLAGITVQLVRSGTVVGTAVTNANGEYYFLSSSAVDGNTGDHLGLVSETVSGQTGIARSTAYVVRINSTLNTTQSNLLNGLGLTTANATDAGADDGGANADARDSDATVSGSNFEISVTTGGAGNNTHTLDFGLAPLGSIGNRVWIDEDSNGYQDEGEDGIANVVVELKNSGGTVLATKRTDSNGYYLFTGLSAGTYFVEVQSGIPAGMTQTTTYPNPGADLFNQDQTTNANGYQVALSAGQDNLTADFGYNWNPTNEVNNGGATNSTAALGDRVWIDTNGNGRQDIGEVGVNNVTVTLYYDAENDGDLDDNNDGTIDSENQYTVGGYTPTRTTDQNGYYIFDALPPGAYTVQVTNSSSASHNVLNTGHYTQTGDPDFWGSAVPAANRDNRTTTAVILGPGDVFLDADFGYDDTGITLGSIGNFVWLDRNANDVGPANAPGTTDTTEVGIGGVSVALIRDLNDDGVWDSNEPIIASQFTSNGTQDVDGDGVTDPLGYYNFRGLSTADNTGDNRNDYLVVVTDVNRMLDGLTQTYDHDGSQTDSQSRVQNLAGAVTTEDFGYTPDNSGQQSSRTTLSTTASGVIGDRVWLDIDGDDVQDANELGIPGVRVYLYQDSDGDGTLDAGESLLATTTTGPEGYYLFPNLTTGTSGDYIVKVDTTTLPGGLTQTYDQDPPETDSTSNVQNLAGTDPNQDFGYRGTGTIGNLVWNDVDADGFKDASESGINGVTLDLYYDANGNGDIDPGEPKVATTTTAGGGAYLFSGLPTDDGVGAAGVQYIVDVSDTAGVLAGYWHSLGSAGVNDNSQTDPYVATITNGAPHNLTADFGYYVLPAALGNFVWNDTDADGIQDVGEAGIDGVVVKLVITYPGANGVVGTGGDDTVTTIYTVTGDDPNTAGTQTGWYSFGNLLQDEDYNGANTVGGGEPTFTISVVTQPGSAPLTNLVKTNVDQGGSDTADSDNHAGVSATATEGQLTVSQGTNTTIASYDFGYTAPVNLGDRIWYDTDNDGSFDATEVGINGVTVSLYRDTNGNGAYDPGTDTQVGASITTAGAGANAGAYNFTLLTPSLAATPNTHYFVVLPDTNFMSGGALVGYRNSTSTVAANSDTTNGQDHGRVVGTLGSSGGYVLTENAAGTNSGSVAVTLAGEPTNDGDGSSGNLTLDFGFYNLQISGTVFVDTNNNGALDTGETPTNGAGSNRTVNLYLDNGATSGQWDAGDTLVSTTQTGTGANSGNYSFGNLASGSYIVGVVQPSGYRSTVDTANATDTNTPNTGADNNDNGVGTASGTVYSKAFTLNAGDSTTNLGNTVTNGTATTSNNKQDFGITSSPTAVDMGEFTAVANADSTVTLKWDTLNELNILGFNVLRGATKQDATTAVNTELVNATSTGQIQGSAYEFTDTMTAGGETYFYKLEILRPNGSRETTKAVKVKTAAGACSAAPAAPNLIGPKDGKKVKKGKTTFTWQAVECAVSYKWQLRQDAPDGGAVAAKKNLTVTQTSIKKLEAGQTYYWRAQACNADDSCTASDWQTLTVKQVKEKSNKNKKKSP